MGENLFDLFGMASERKGRLQKCSATDLGLRLGVVFVGAEREVKVWNQATYFPGRNGLWVHRECMLEFGINFLFLFCY